MIFSISGAYPKKGVLKPKAGFRYDEAYVKILDWETGKIVNELHYKSPIEHRDIQASQMFKAGTILDGTLILPSSTEILFIELKSLKILKTISIPSFADLHHVTVKGQVIYVANTGAECVQLMDFDGNIIGEYHQASNPTWKKFKYGTDLRFIGSTKPHEIHLNHVFFINDEPWFTRFKQRDAIALHDPHKRIELGYSEGKPHDGLVLDDYVYFTLTDGYIVIVNKHTLKTEEVIDLNGISDKRLQLGWCRGIEVIENDAFVGFSSIRKSKFVEYGKWIVQGKKLPARVAQYDLKDKELKKEVEINHKGAAIFMVKKIEIKGNSVLKQGSRRDVENEGNRCVEEISCQKTLQGIAGESWIQ